MTLLDTLRKKTDARELCMIRKDGYVIASAYIDYEDLFAIPASISYKEVKNDEWGTIDITIPIKIGDKKYESIPCHYFDI